MHPDSDRSVRFLSWRLIISSARRIRGNFIRLFPFLSVRSTIYRIRFDSHTDNNERKRASVQCALTVTQRAMAEDNYQEHVGSIEQTDNLGVSAILIQLCRVIFYEYKLHFISMNVCNN